MNGMGTALRGRHRALHPGRQVLRYVMVKKCVLVLSYGLVVRYRLGPSSEWYGHSSEGTPEFYTKAGELLGLYEVF